MRFLYNKSIFIQQPDLETIHHTLAILTPRIIATGHCVKFMNKFYKTMWFAKLDIDAKGNNIHTTYGIVKDNAAQDAYYYKS